MPDEIVGSARIVISPDLTGFESQLTGDVTAAAQEAAAALQASFSSAAQSSAAVLNDVNAVSFDGIVTSVDTAGQAAVTSATTAAAELNAAFGTLTPNVVVDVTVPDAEVATAVRSIEDRIASLTGQEQEIVLRAATAEAEASIRAIETQLRNPELTDVEIRILLDERSDITGTIDDISSRLSGLDASAQESGTAIDDGISSGAQSAATSLTDLGGTGAEVAASLAGDFDTLAKGVAATFAAVGGAKLLGGLIAAGEEVRSVAAVSNQLIETTGGVANVTQANIQSLGDEFERLIGVDGELVQASSNVLLTFKNVRNEAGEGNDVFNRAVESAADLSAVLGTDLSGSTLQLGKALQDPVRGVNALRRAGVDFSAEQREMIKGFVESNDLLSAQVLILDEVESQVGGAAEAAAKSSDVLRRAVENVGEDIGAGILPAVDELAAELPGVLDDLAPQMQELGQAIGTGLELGVDALIALAPLLGTTTDLVLVLTPALELAVNLFDAIPDPVLQVAAAVVVMNRALTVTQTLARAQIFTSLVTGLAGVAVPAGAVSGAFTTGAAASVGLRAGLAGLLASISPLTIALTALAAPVVLYNKVIGDAEKQGQSYGESIRASFDPATASLAELESASAQLDEDIRILSRDVDDSFLGRNTVNRDLNAALNEGIDQATAFKEEIDEAAAALRRAQAEAEFGPLVDSFLASGEALERLGDAAPDVSGKIASIRVNGDLTEAAFVDLIGTLGEATLSEEEMGDAALALGTDVETLKGAVDQVNGAIDQFVSDATSGLVSVSTVLQRTLGQAQEAAGAQAQAIRDQAATEAQAIRDEAARQIEAAGDSLSTAQADAIRDAADQNAEAVIDAAETSAAAVAESGTITAGALTQQLTVAATELADFRGDLRAIADAGFADLAGLIAESGQEVGGALADELSQAVEDRDFGLLQRLSDANAAFETETQATVTYLRESLGPELILTTGLIGEGAAQALFENLDFAERIRIQGELAKSGLTTEGQAIAAIAAVEGADAAEEYGKALDIEQEVIDESVRAGIAIRRSAPVNSAGLAGDSVGAAWGDGFVAGVKRKELEAAFASQGLVGAALIAARKLAGIRSPSTLFAREVGEPIGEGVAVGITDSVGLVDAAMADLVGSAAVVEVSSPTVRAVTVDQTGPVLGRPAVDGLDGQVVVVFEDGAVRMSFDHPPSPEEAEEIGRAVGRALGTSAPAVVRRIRTFGQTL